MSPRRRCDVRSLAGRISSGSAPGSRTMCRSCSAIWCRGRRSRICFGIKGRCWSGEPAAPTGRGARGQGAAAPAGLPRAGAAINNALGRIALERQESQAADDEPKRRRHGRAVDRHGGRGLPSLPATWAARQLSRVEPARAPVRQAARPRSEGRTVPRQPLRSPIYRSRTSWLTTTKTHKPSLRESQGSSRAF